MPREGGAPEGASLRTARRSASRNGKESGSREMRVQQSIAQSIAQSIRTGHCRRHRPLVARRLCLDRQYYGRRASRRGRTGRRRGVGGGVGGHDRATRASRRLSRARRGPGPARAAAARRDGSRWQLSLQRGSDHRPGVESGRPRSRTARRQPSARDSPAREASALRAAQSRLPCAHGFRLRGAGHPPGLRDIGALGRGCRGRRRLRPQPRRRHLVSRA